MSFSRSLSVFILSAIFTSSVSAVITIYTLGGSLQKDFIKSFLTTEGTNFIEKQCQADCSKYTTYQAECLNDCNTQLSGQALTMLDTAVDQLYSQRIMGTSLEEVSSLSRSFMLFVLLSFMSGTLIFFVSKTPLSTMGKDLISVAVVSIAVAFMPQFIMAYMSLPLDMSQIINDYFSLFAAEEIKIGIILLAIGGGMLLVNRFIEKRKK